MNTTQHATSLRAVAAPGLSDLSALESLIQRVCARIAPSWPLDRMIAVNPFWGLVSSPIRTVASQLRALSGAQLIMPRAWYRQQYRANELRDEHLVAAIEREGSAVTLSDLRALLECTEPVAQPCARVVDVADRERDLDRDPSWRAFVTNSVSQHCAAFFDEGQAAFRPSRSSGLYANWLRHAREDRSPALLMGAKPFRLLAGALPESATVLIREALAALKIAAEDREEYLWALLLDQNGWASWCAYRRWTARLDRASNAEGDDSIVDLLAIRLAYEWLVYRLGGDELSRAWAKEMRRWPELRAAAARARRDDWLLQSAVEIAWRAPIVRELSEGGVPRTDAAVSAQAVFCIDVRSEVYRRALEGVAPAVQTLGFAGFFGLPVEYQPIGAETARPQLPGLLAPRLRVVDRSVNEATKDQRRAFVQRSSAWNAFKTDALSTLAFVDALGVTYAAKLVAESLGLVRSPSVDRVGLSAASDARRKLALVRRDEEHRPLDLDARCALAASMLSAMSLTRDFARLVLLVGHGSESRNNPHGAALDCGACCGQTGEVNARVAAALLNDREVRAALAQRSRESAASRRPVVIPDETRFVAALHNTTSDEVTLFDLDEVPSTHAADLRSLRASLTEASRRARIERAARLGLDATNTLRREVEGRTRDWAQVRPEWGLASNAAFIVAPRERTRQIDLQGRAFLHEYRHEQDDGHAVLEAIMTAPMVVTHWINFQYYASTVDNARYGSGNKALHNVVGGHIGVFEGNGGDLRVGLSLQSLHNGARWCHAPLRLSVFIEAPRAAIDAVIAKHQTVRDLVNNGWLALYQIDDERRAIFALRDGEWRIEPSALAQ